MLIAILMAFLEADAMQLGQATALDLLIHGSGPRPPEG